MPTGSCCVSGRSAARSRLNGDAPQGVGAARLGDDREGLMRALVHAPTKRNVLIKDATHFVLFEKNRNQFFEEILKFMKE